MADAGVFGYHGEIEEPGVAREGAEHELLARVARHDREALALLYARFQRPLFRYLVHLLGQREQAENVLQEVMLVVWQRAHTFRGASGASTWIFGIAHHQAFKALRAGGRVTLVELEAAPELPDVRQDPEADVLRRATADAITHALTTLSPAHREVLELAFFHDFAGADIAAIVGVPIGTVKSRLSYARRALRDALLSDGWEA